MENEQLKVTNFNFKNNGKLSLSLNNILLKVNELDLWKYYTNKSDITIEKSFKVPYRKDKNPSFIIYSNSNGRLIGKDFRGDFLGDVIQYIQFTSTKKLTFYEVLKIINYDFNLNLLVKKIINNNTNSSFNNPSSISKLQTLNSPLKEKEDKYIQFEIKKYSNEELAYFKEQGINSRTLSFYNVYSVKRAYLNSRLIYIEDELDFCFAYYYPITKKTKLYYPLRNNYRFLSNTSNEKEFQGLEQLKKQLSNPKFKKYRDIVIITKSYKDVMLFHELRFHSIAPHGEGHYIPKEIIEYLKNTFKQIFVFYDNDFTGINNMRKLRKEYPFISPFAINRRKYQNVKDLCELYKKYGLIISLEFIKNNIKLKKLKQKL
jgi:hypothetical protein